MRKVDWKKIYADRCGYQQIKDAKTKTVRKCLGKNHGIAKVIYDIMQIYDMKYKNKNKRKKA